MRFQRGSDEFSRVLTFSDGMFAIAVAVVSGLEVVLFRHAYRSKLLAREMPEAAFRYGVRASSLPLVFFALSVPVAFVSSSLAVAVWALAAPTQALLDRSRPSEASEWFSG